MKNDKRQGPFKKKKKKEERERERKLRLNCPRLLLRPANFNFSIKN